MTFYRKPCFTLPIFAVIAIFLFSGCSKRGPSAEGYRHDTALASRIRQRVGSLAMASPQEALAVIDSAESAGCISTLKAMEYRAAIYYNPMQEDAKAIEYARKALDMDSKELKDREKIILLRILGYSYYFSGEYESSINSALQGESLAVAMDSIAAQGEFKFITGECMMKLGQVASGYANMEFGIAALSKEDGLQAKSTLSHLLGEEMNFMIDDGQYQEALQRGRRREAILDEIMSEYGADGYLDQQFGYLYGKMAFLYSKTGDNDRAVDYAAKFWDTSYSKDRNGKLRILEYCLETRQAQKALEIIGATDFPASGDTLSSDGSYYLRLKAEACNQNGDFRRAYSLLNRSYSISDSLNRKIDSEKALKAFTLYHTHEVELKAKESEAREARYLLILILIIMLCIILAAAFTYYYFSTKTLIEKSRLIAMGRSDTKDYIKLLQSAQAKINELSPKSETSSKVAEADSWQLFLKLEDAMESKRLYLDKTITRADILELLGIGKNRLAQMFQDVGDDLSLPTYINGKRLNHALEVIGEHPEYTMVEVAEASGFANTRNFHLLFKKRFGITPMQYRNGK